MNRKLWLAGALVVAVSFAGCVPEGKEVNVTFYGAINGTSGEFQMDGRLVSEGGFPNQDTYDSVTVMLYAEDETTLCQEELGDLQTEYGRLNVSLTTMTLPYYVVFNSPDFWTGKMTVTYYERTDSGYIYQEAGSRNGLPVDTTNATGPSCGTPE